MDLRGQLLNPTQQLLTLISNHGKEGPERAPRRRYPTQRQRRLTKQQTESLVAEYEAGALVIQLATNYKISRQTVSNMLRRRQVALRPKGLSGEQIQAAVVLYAQGASVATIGKALGVDGKTVWSRLKEQGVEMRDSHGRKL